MLKIKKNEKLKVSTEAALFFVLIAVLFAFSLLSEYFLSFGNFMKICLYSSQIGILAGGMTLVLLSGGIDVSVGSTMAFAGITAAKVMEAGGPWYLAVLAGIALGGLCGLINAVIITRGRVTAFITTLGTMTIYRGLAQICSNGKTILISDEIFKAMGRKYLFRVIPIPAVLMILTFVIFQVVLKYTKFGRQVYAVGGNEKASFLAGIQVTGTHTAIYTIEGFCAGLAGILLAAQSGAGIPSAAGDINMEAISAVILGGVSLSGGKGKIGGTVLGVLILACLNNGLNLLAVSAFYQEVIRGLVLILAVWFDMMKERKE